MRVARNSRVAPINSGQGGTQFSMVEGVDRFETEVLFVAVACDDILGPVIQAEHRKYFPNARMAEIEDAGHEMFLDNPEASLAEVREYFAERNR